MKGFPIVLTKKKAGRHFERLTNSQRSKEKVNMNYFTKDIFTLVEL